MVQKFQKTVTKLPFFSVSVSAGFPSPADDYVERRLDLNDLLIKHPAATFFVKVKGNSMVNAGILSGDILVVDRSMATRSGDIIIAVLDGEFLVKGVKKHQNKIYLLPENPEFKPIVIHQYSSFEVWGVVTSVIHQFKN